MGQEEAVSIRPAAGGPRLKKNGRLQFHQGLLEVTDPRGRTHTFDLSGGNGPYEFRYGSWEGEADFALIDGSGRAVLLVDQKSFHLGDMTRLQDATGLKCDEAGTRPPTTRDTVALVNLPYVMVGYAVFGVGAVAFGLWSVTHIEFFVLGVTLPAVIILIPLLIVGRRSILSGADFKAEWPKVQQHIDETLALSDKWLADHKQPPIPEAGEEQGLEEPPKPPAPERRPDGY
jgi:hypothetical protein